MTLGRLNGSRLAANHKTGLHHTRRASSSSVGATRLRRVWGSKKQPEHGQPKHPDRPLHREEARPADAKKKPNLPHSVKSAALGHQLVLAPDRDAKAQTAAGFVGALACKACHGEKFSGWQQSAHGQAGSTQAHTHLLANLNGKRLRLVDGEVAFQANGAKLEIQVGLDGRAPVTMTVAGVVGRGLMYGGGGQSLFVKSPDGRYLLFPIEYNATSKTWYCQTNDNGWMPLLGQEHSQRLWLATDTHARQWPRCGLSKLSWQPNLRQLR